MEKQMKFNFASNKPPTKSAFSLLELLVVIAVLGVILFFAFPNIVQIKSDSENELAKARAETLNLAAAAYFQDVGPTTALSNWTGKSDDERYEEFLMPYIAFPAPTLEAFMPSSEYTVNFHPTEPHRQKATLLGPDDPDITY
jgi:prepilin-type N-terminal cleavage/methylation domain-containing protein